MSNFNNVYILIPAYNEENVIAGVLDKVHKIFPNVVCVDDGSSDSTSLEVVKTKAKLVRHTVNLGQGAAIQTAIEFALLDKKAKYFVTFDADGQHSLDDVLDMLEVIMKKKVDMVLGSRFLGKTENMSYLKKILLKSAIVFTNKTTGLKLTDAHNGLRVFNRHVAETIDITMPDMSHASEITEKIALNDYSYVESPVTISYTDYSKSKGQSMINAINIGFDILLSKIEKHK